MKRLSRHQIVLLHEQLITETGGISGLGDEALLESAAAAPFAAFGCVDIYPSCFKKRRVLGVDLCKTMRLLTEING